MTKTRNTGKGTSLLGQIMTAALHMLHLRCLQNMSSRKPGRNAQKAVGTRVQKAGVGLGVLAQTQRSSAGTS